jgi:hypothetical protein
MYRGAHNIHPIEDVVYRAPYGGFAEKRRDRENTFDLCQRSALHAPDIVIDIKNSSKNRIGPQQRDLLLPIFIS